MRYVSSICDGSKSAKLSRILDDVANVVVHDTESGLDTVMPVGAGFCGDIIGVGKIGYSVYVVPHAPHEAALYNHIIRAESSKNRYLGSDFDGADFCAIVGYSPNNYVEGYDNHKTLSCLISPDAPEIGGYRGSVVSYIPRFSETPKLCTLYRYLSILYKSSGLNIFRYETIHLYDNRSRNTTVIKLSQTADAQRFFMKMMLTI